MRGKGISFSLLGKDVMSEFAFRDAFNIAVTVARERLKRPFIAEEQKNIDVLKQIGLRNAKYSRSHSSARNVRNDVLEELQEYLAGLPISVQNPLFGRGFSIASMVVELLK